MRYKPTLEEWNWYVLMLGQALIGAISANFRMVSLNFSNKGWQVEVTLQAPSKDDEEEIIDVVDDFAVYVDDVRKQISDHAYQKISTNVVISQQFIYLPLKNEARVIFKRKE